MSDKKFIVVILVLIVTAGISFFAYMPAKFDDSSSVKMADFPKTIGDWVSEDIPLKKREYELLETNNLIMRNYTNKNGDKVNLYIIYSQENRKVAHPPEICLQGGGAIITNQTTLQITDSIKATKIILEKNTSRDLVAYWYKVGNLNTNIFLKQQLTMSINKLFGKKTSIALIRVLTEMENNNEEVSLDKLKGFCKLIEPVLERYVP